MGGNAQGTSYGSVQSTMPANELTFECAVQNNDNTPPEISLLGSATGSITVGAFTDNLPITSAAVGTATPGYPVTVSGLSVGTSVIEIAGDNVDDGYIQATINPQPTETFSVNAASIALVTPTAQTQVAQASGVQQQASVGKAPAPNTPAAGTPIKSPTATETLPKAPTAPASGSKK